MSIKVIEVQSDTINNAKSQLKNIIPDGSFPVSLKIISDGSLKIVDKQSITQEAASLKEARKSIKSDIPEGYRITREEIITRGSNKKIVADANNEEQAYRNAQNQIPAHAIIMNKKVLVPSETKEVSVAACNEITARRKALDQFNGRPEIKYIRIVSSGRKGFLGIGRKPNHYSVSVSIHKASVEISYCIKTKIKVTIEKTEKTDVVLEARVVDGVDTLLDTMREIANSNSGLRDFDPDQLNDGYLILDALESLNDSRVPGILLEYLKNHTDTDRNAANMVLKSLEKINAGAAKGEMIEIIFQNLQFFHKLHFPDLFGKYTKAIKALVKAFEPVVESQNAGWRDNDGYETRLRYETAPLKSEFQSLCAINTPVSSNILYKLATLPKMPVPLGYSDKGDLGQIDPIESIDIRQEAKNELIRRHGTLKGIYDINAFQEDKSY